MTKQHNKAYLVTGGCGFIGSHVVDALIERQDQVIVLDNLSSGTLDNLNSKAEFIEGDIRDQQLVNELMQRVNGCFHFAAIAPVEFSNREWLAAHQVNLTGTINIFNAARAENVGTSIPVVYASSSAVYGDTSSLLLSESELPHPISAYGADKRGCELHARAASLVHQVPTTGLRFFNVYGPRQNPNSPYSGVISIFVDRALKGIPINIYGDGNQTRDFIYIADVVQYCLTAMEKISLKPEIFNICTGEPTSINHLIVLLNTLIQQTIQCVYNPPRIGDILHSCGDPNKAIKTLELQPTFKLIDGLNALTIESRKALQIKQNCNAVSIEPTNLAELMEVL